MVDPAQQRHDIEASGANYRERAVVPARTAVLSIDMQQMEVGVAERQEARISGTRQNRHAAFYERVENTVIPAQQKVLQAARASGIEVIFTVIESLTADGRDRSLDHKISHLHAAKGSFDAQVIPEVGPAADDIIIPKTSSGIFNSTNIDYVLRNLGVEYLVIMGVVTDQCVESAVRDAADRGFLVTLIEDGCAAYSDRNHNDCMEAMDGHYSRVRSADEFVAELAALKT
ncbi:cysteine hydrolase [Aureimonas fodinaquatilis]|uniref:Cysteine hydrolase n=1 Tax=Aureimonas fodinaquatilis TaxID=2565783 RepID=A0A5B0DUI8_9HYPH|nr:isochorismatase family cysteine hydrolase [Aureimonas fodinaquatilis]KAA0969605.1 cysteine hydrolase [Aureimonas fodinaquatilis]